MRKYFCFFFLLIVFNYLQAQDKTVRELKELATKQLKSLDSSGWKRNGTFILGINQGALSNWAPGGEQSVLGVNAILNYSVNFRRGKNIWDNYFDLALGFQNATSFGRFRKIDDRIDITSKYGYLVNHHWYAGVLTNFNSQSLAGYDYSIEPNKKVSNFLTPGKILISPGIDYKTKTRFSLFLSPVTIRWVLKRDRDFLTISKFGVDSAKKVNIELGAFVMAKYKAVFAKWATYAGRIDLFSNYRRKPGNIDLLMNNLLTMKFNPIISTNVSLDVIYDDDVKKRLQIKEIMGIGFTIKL